MDAFPLFGGNIEPSCAYCAYSARAADGHILCCAAKPPVPAPAPCAKYRYDPLRRVPRRTPRLPEFAPEDFKL